MKGYTLIELVLTIVIVGIIAAVSAQVLVRGIDAYTLITNRKDALQHARVGMDRMIDELILLNSSKISSISDTKIGFWDDTNALTNFRRTSQGGNLVLYRGDDFLAGIVGLLDFDYFKSTGAPAVWPWDVRRINIELTIQALGGVGSIPLRTEVFPRGFMYNNFR